MCVCVCLPQGCLVSFLGHRLNLLFTAATGSPICIAMSKGGLVAFLGECLSCDLLLARARVCPSRPPAQRRTIRLLGGRGGNVGNPDGVRDRSCVCVCIWVFWNEIYECYVLRLRDGIHTHTHTFTQTHSHLPGAEPVSLRGIAGTRTALVVSSVVATASTSMRSVCMYVCVCIYIEV